MKMPSSSRRATGIALSAIIVCFSLSVSALVALAQSGIQPFTPPPSAPGVSWPPETLKKLKSYESMMDHAARKGDAKSYARAALGVGVLHLSVSDWAVALEYYKHGLDAAIAARDAVLQADLLGSMGIVYGKLGQQQDAESSLLKSADLYQEVLSSPRGLDFPYNAQHERLNQAATVMNLGGLYLSQQQYSKAIDSLNQALSLATAIGNVRQQSHVMINLGLAHLDMGAYAKGLDLLNEAAALCEQDHDEAGEAAAFGNIGFAYQTLGQYEKSLDFLQRALTIVRSIHDRQHEGVALEDIGLTYQFSGDKQKALSFCMQALTIFQDIGDKDGQALDLMAIGFATSELGDQQKALTYLAQALPLARGVGDRRVEAFILSITGLTYAQLGDRQKAIENYNQAIPIVTSLGNPLNEAHLFYSLSLAYKDDQPALAAFYGKQAIARVQQTRANIQSLGEDTDRSLLESRIIGDHPITDYYRTLADILIGQGRLTEAQQVMDLLKLQEYKDYARGNPVSATETPASPPLNTAESKAEEQYRSSADHLVALGAQWEALKNITPRSFDQEKQFQQLSDQLSLASKEMDSYYQRIYVTFGKNSNANREIAEVKGDVALLRQQLAHLPRTIALYTIVGKEHYSVIVITSATTVVREFPIGEEDLNKKIDSFTKILRLPEADPKPQAAEMYRILVGPIAADLDQAHASTLMWLLDGKLRYLPISALYDGKQYLVQRYNSVSISPVSIAHLSDKPDMRRMSVIAMGISKKYEGLDALPNVEAEMNSIVKNPVGKIGKGVLPGSILLDGAFTERAMEAEFSGKHPIVHIASHFVLSPGDDSRSYLLLAGKDQSGTGYHLTVADFRDNQRLALDETELLTLSACNTGIGGNSDGREVDGLATTAQLKGAKSVIASLWSVNDMSTANLMADFYHRWTAGNGSVAKAEALRQAQLDLLTGKTGLKGSSSDRASFSQPYYWAPFILMGNWQ